MAGASPKSSVPGRVTQQLHWPRCQNSARCPDKSPLPQTSAPLHTWFPLHGMFPHNPVGRSAPYSLSGPCSDVTSPGSKPCLSSPAGTGSLSEYLGVQLSRGLPASMREALAPEMVMTLSLRATMNQWENSESKGSMAQCKVEPPHPRPAWEGLTLCSEQSSTGRLPAP